jgi:CrcB protein
MSWVFVFIGGGIGSVFRFAISKWNMLNFGNFPVATLFTNFLASSCLGLILWLGTKYGKNDWYLPLFSIGFCGGFSTFSTFSMENIQLIQQGNYMYAFLNTACSLILSGLAFYLLIKLPQL